MPDKPFAEYAQRNAAPILEVLRHELRGHSNVLEIGSGTGQHAVHFAAELSHLQWQTSDLDENHDGISSWIADAGLPNVRGPLSLDVTTAELSDNSYDAVYSSNTAHIMSPDAVVAMFRLVGTVLRRDGLFILYGPFRQAGRFNTQSNREFDADLRSRDPSMGIRDLDELDKLGAENGLRRLNLYAVPSNNLVAVWQKAEVSAE
ncbi:MAG: class I SAM-dependent methyltransferase [Gammaproteobacteria bacterium]|nr:class I SAM-dependent methyltransferase [Gammaproteobacteria bacterium]